MSLGIVAATTLGGVVTGLMVGDALGAVPTRVAVPATSNSAKAKATASGVPVGGAPTPRQSLFLSAFVVVAAVGVLIVGSKVLKDARVG